MAETDSNKAQPQRKIIHIDFDAFFASIEIRDNPTLSGKPIAVGGAADRRGVIATCNYEARSFGVHSAMASAYAKRLCPNLQIITPRLPVYKDVSQQAHSVFNQYTDLVEPLSLDEAYLDVSLSTCCQASATLIAKDIRKQIFQKIGVTVSAGVAPNKFLAKIASDWHKPDGLCVITPDKVNEFVFELPVVKILGVGKITAAKLHRQGIETCGSLLQYSRTELTSRFGSFGFRLWELARGIDDRPVVTDRRRKSLSVEHTYNKDLTDLNTIVDQVVPLVDDLWARYQLISSEYSITGLFVKMKFDDFSQTTLEESINQKQPTPLNHFKALISRAWKRGNRSVRLLGVGIRLHDMRPPGQFKQLELYPMTLKMQKDWFNSSPPTN
ncbi:MAG: DNA polymerase IV [Candidatus Endonucleobacter bathymodioli]|uniref:DNA polymerase IV n=1 Tax=Candidatus Endonucleibacter bathymodioli TaxID=539814 RepID=A0AA90SNE2_9GAMM|nr:DNA polymerase IV [Candidatus Endonucleobacter bathymodioli]